MENRKVDLLMGIMKKIWAPTPETVEAVMARGALTGPSWTGIGLETVSHEFSCEEKEQ